MYKKTVRLISDTPIDYGRWNNYSLDLSEMVKTDPGAIYKVYLSFKKSESMYPCGQSTEANMTTVEEEEEWDEDDT